MVLFEVLLNVAMGVALALLLTTPMIVGKERLVDVRHQLPHRLKSAAPYFGLLVVTLLVNAGARRFGPDVSWIIGWEITGLIYDIEGMFVPQLQGLMPEWLITYFSFIYVHGYVYLLVFPLIAYLALDDQASMRKTVVAYTLNYAIGLACYIVVIAYGPRNLLPHLVEPFLYLNWPRAQILTSEINVNTNVFPSLHTSLSATVAILAFRTRDVYPRWFPVAMVISVSVILSTMVLGIHWAIDVVAGLGLAWLSVRLADRVERRFHGERREFEVEAAA